MAIVVPNLFFATRISQMAKQLSVEIASLTPDRALDSCIADPPAAMIVDLEALGDPIGLIRALKAAPATASIRIVGFYPHVHNALRVSALAAGADLVLPRSSFSARLPELLAELGGSAP